MPQSKARVKYEDVLDALEFSSAGEEFDSRAYVDLDTDAILYVSSEFGTDEEIPDDIETSERYLAVPSKRELDLGHDLVFAFVAQAMPGEYDTVRGFFRQKGAYARFKDFLERRALLQRWREFEARETEDALRDWCDDNGIEIAGTSASY